MISIDTNACWCDRHRLPFKPDWPRGYAMATMALFTEATKRNDIIEYCGGERNLADANKLTAALLEFSPLCCLIGDEKTAYWTDLALTPDAAEDFKQMLDDLRNS